MKKWITENWLIVLLAVVLFVAVSVMAYMTWLYDGDNRGIIYAFLRDVAAGCLVLIGAIALLQRVASQNRTAEAQHKTVEATLQSNEQTIFKDGLAFLSEKSDSVRLGGIYNLHELAIQNPKRSKEVLEILCAHLRSKTNEEGYQKKYKTGPSVEISSLLKLLTSNESELRKVYEENSGEKCILNFQGAFLRSADLRGIWLKGADLSYSQLQMANLSKAQMQGAEFREAQMQGVQLKEAQMQGAKFWKAQMQKAEFQEAQMQGVQLWKAQMQGGKFLKTQMQGVFMEDAQMQGAKLWTTQMQGAQLLKAQMQGAILIQAYMQCAWLSEVQMQGAMLLGVYMQEADLYGVNLRGVSGRSPYIESELNSTANSNEDTADYEKFKSRIKSRQGKPTELNDQVIFGGEFNQEDKEWHKEALQQVKQYILPAMSGWFKGKQRALQNLDVDTEPSYEIPEEGVVTGVLDEQEADQIIEKYEKAMAWEQDDDEDD